MIEPRTKVEWVGFQKHHEGTLGKEVHNETVELFLKERVHPKKKLMKCRFVDPGTSKTAITETPFK